MKRQYKEILPSYNDQMHKDNPYFHKPPDFSKLAKEYPIIQQFIIKNGDGRISYNFSEKNAAKCFIE